MLGQGLVQRSVAAERLAVSIGPRAIGQNFLRILPPIWTTPLAVQMKNANTRLVGSAPNADRSR